MKLRILSVVLLLAAAWCAWGGEKRLFPIGEVQCAPLTEVKGLRIAGCRVEGTKDFVLAVAVTFVHHALSNKDVVVSVKFDGLGAGFVSDTSGSAPVMNLPPNKQATAKIVLSGLSLDDNPELAVKFLAAIKLIPEISFICSRPAPR